MATDYISTETGCQYLRKYKIEDCAGILYDKGFNDGIETAISCIGNEVPAADVRPVVMGRWIPNRKYDYYYKCSVCNEIGPLEPDGESAFKYNFCPNCGADMMEVKVDG